MTIHKPSQKVVLAAASAVCIVCVALFWFLTREYFIKRFVVPQLRSALNCPVQAGSIDFAPFAHIYITDLRLGAAEHPFLSAKAVSFRYNPWRMLFGEVLIKQLHLDGASFHLAQDASGKLNIPWVKKAGEGQLNNEPPAKTPEAAPTSFAIMDMQITNSDIHWQRSFLEQQEERIELKSIAFRLPHLRTNSGGQLTFASDISLSLMNGTVIEQAKLSLELASHLDKHTLPKSVTAKLLLSGITGAAGPIVMSGQDLALALDFRISPNFSKIEWDSAVLEGSRQGEQFIKVASTGAFQTKEKAGVVDLKVEHIDQRLLDYLPAVKEHFDSFELAGEGKIELKANNEQTANGTLSVSHFKLKDSAVDNSALPKLEVGFDLVHTVQDLLVNRFTLHISQNDETIGQASLSGDVSLPLSTKESKLVLSSETLNIDKLKLLLSQGSPPSQMEQQPELIQNPTPPPAALPEVLRSAVFRADVNMQQLLWGKLKSTNVLGSILLKDGRLTIPNLSWTQDGAKASWTSGVDLVSLPMTYQYEAELHNWPLKPVQETFGVPGEDMLIGELGYLRTKGKGVLGPEAVKSFVGDLHAQFTGVGLPAKLQSVPPFNIIFLPFELLANISSLIGGVVMPAIVVDSGTRARAWLSEQGRLSIHRGTLKLRAGGNKITVEDASFESDLLSKLSLSGTVGFDKSVDFTAALRVAVINLRVPIVGSLDSPYPNVVTLVPQLIGGLGLGVFDLIADQFKSLESQDPQEVYEQLKSGSKPLLTVPPPKTPTIVTADRLSNTKETPKK
jgi:hypothetical protein